MGTQREDLFIIMLAGMEFTFRTEDELMQMVHTLFRFAEDKKVLYQLIVADTIDTVLTYCGSGTSPDCGMEQLKMLSGIKKVKDHYGAIYDPDQESFKVLDDEYGLLG